MEKQWEQLKETIIELRDSGGTGSQHDICAFLINYMLILENKEENNNKSYNRLDEINDIFEGL